MAEKKGDDKQSHEKPKRPSNSRDETDESDTTDRVYEMLRELINERDALIFHNECASTDHEEDHNSDFSIDSDEIDDGRVRNNDRRPNIMAARLNYTHDAFPPGNARPIQTRRRSKSKRRKGRSRSRSRRRSKRRH